MSRPSSEPVVSLVDEDEDPGRTDLTEAGAAIPEDIHPWVLTVLEGSDAGTRVEVDGTLSARVLLGTSPACEVRLTDTAVSRRHAALEPTARGLRYTDLESTNGSRVGGVLIGEAFFAGGEIVSLGATKIRFDREADAKTVIPGATCFGRVVGASSQMRRLFALAARVASSNVPVIIEGETGTGKEALAEAIHEASPRATGPFVVVDCTAIAPSLVEAELFGHERGAFTGAVSTRKGLFEEADGGTLFIDEIGDLDVALQSKLLRAIERGEIRRVGGSKWVKLDVRIVAATRRDLDRAVQDGAFRDDLFFRLAVARLELPPLRKRAGDVEVLARHFWRELGGADVAFPSDLLLKHAGYDWPGNVRELQNAVAKRLALGEEGDASRQSKLEEPRAQAAPQRDLIDEVISRKLKFTAAREAIMAEFERRYVEDVLAETGGNVGEAAKRSGLARRYFQIVRARRRDG